VLTVTLDVLDVNPALAAQACGLSIDAIALLLSPAVSRESVVIDEIPGAVGLRFSFELEEPSDATPAFRDDVRMAMRFLLQAIMHAAGQEPRVIVGLT
jgi:hypothetical protein